MSVVSTAMQYMGTPYVWGGTTPNGFDCSGLVQYSFAQNGITIPRTSQEQFSYTSNSRITNIADLQSGDLVFFRSSGTDTAPGHVGLYIGGGKFIEAPHSGDVVKISDISTRSDFVGGGRVNGSASESYSLMGSGGDSLNFLGKVITFILVLIVAVIGIIFFAKAFDIPTSKESLIKKVVGTDKKKKENSTNEIKEDAAEVATDVISSIDDDITELIS